jgi:hypothetical protein
MSSYEPRRSRLVASLLALAAAAALTVALVAPAQAYKGEGSAVIVSANHDKGRTLSGQGVKILPGTDATAAGGKLTLPVAELNPGVTGAQPSAQSSAALTFKRGKQSLSLTGIRFDLAKGTLVGTLDGATIPIFWLGAAPQVNSTSGTIVLSDGKLRLTAAAASALKEELGLKRALVRKNVGMLWLAAQAFPTHAPAQKVTAGALEWGFLTSWREYIYKSLGPNTVGSITTEGGATTVGEPAKPGSYFSFPASGGAFHKGLFGASSTLSLTTAGSVKFAKPGHCIIEIKLSDIVVTLGTSSSIVANLNYDIDKFNGMGCDPVPPASLPNTQIATLGSVIPSESANGQSIAWAGLPASLSAAAAKPFEPQYKAGQALDPATVTVNVEPLPVAHPAGS